MTVSEGASIREWYSAAEIAALGLPGLPTTKRRVNELAAVECWASRVSATGARLSRSRQLQGGGIEYHVSLFPADAQALLSSAHAISRVSAIIQNALAILSPGHRRQVLLDLFAQEMRG